MYARLGHGTTSIVRSECSSLCMIGGSIIWLNRVTVDTYLCLQIRCADKALLSAAMLRYVRTNEHNTRHALAFTSGH